MNPTVKFSCRVTATDPGLTLSAKIDDYEFWRGDPWGSHDLAFDLQDVDGTHMLSFELSGKTSEHTKVDSSGQITHDVTISIEDIRFDTISLGYLVHERAIYKHDFNGASQQVQDQFYGTMGCNGTVTFEFTTPIYLWLLENM